MREGKEKREEGGGKGRIGEEMKLESGIHESYEMYSTVLHCM